MRTICTALLLALSLAMQAGQGAAAQADTAQADTGQADTGQEAADFYDGTVSVRLLEQGEVLALPLHDYLIDVVLQEMPASFETEALKAQDVAARTFTMQRIYGGGSHEDADVCGDPTCCQCYLDEAEGRDLYGEGYAAARDKVRAAVEETDGQVLVYGGELIEAAYFSSTGGSTEAAAAVWGGDVPYLQPVSSPETPRVRVVTVSLTDFRAALPEAALDGEPAAWFGETERTAGGAVAAMTIGGVRYTGGTLRSRFSLPSARFTAAVTADGICFEVTGSGHGVGLSQYGADEMARAGADYRDILLHYYTGAELKELY